jgi:hypothetical protein
MRARWVPLNPAAYRAIRIDFDLNVCKGNRRIVTMIVVPHTLQRLIQIPCPVAGARAIHSTAVKAELIGGELAL